MINNLTGPWRLRSPKYNFRGKINALTWSNGFCSERGKKGGLVGKGRGPWQRNAVIIIFNEIYFGGFIQFFPLGKAHKAHFLASIWCNKSWEACPPSMCLDHIKARERYHSSIPYTLTLLTHVSSNNVGHLELKNLSAYFYFFCLPTVYYMPHNV